MVMLRQVHEGLPDSREQQIVIPDRKACSAKLKFPPPFRLISMAHETAKPSCNFLHYLFSRGNNSHKRINLSLG
jgi:hypothetical protein